jgi:hypothetical protein
MAGARTVPEWRATVYLCPTVSNGVKVLLLYLADRMDERRNVSVPRVTIARAHAVPEIEIKRRMTEAHKAGLLDTISRGQKGRTAVYQGLFRGGSTPPPERRRKGTGWLPPEQGFRGGSTPPPSSKYVETFVSGSNSVGTHRSSSSPSSNFNLPAPPDHKQTDSQTPNHGAHPSQTDDPHVSRTDNTKPSSNPATDQAAADSSVNGVSDSAAARLDEPAGAFATRPTTNRTAAR